MNTTKVCVDGNEFLEMNVYEIKGLCEEMVRALLESDKPDTNNLKEKYYSEYANKYTRFNPCIEFCLHELGIMIMDPLCLGNGEVLASNGNRSYIISQARFNTPGFSVKSIDRTDIGQPKLTDETIGYDANIANIENIKEGIIDSEGYVDSTFVGSNEALGELIHMDQLFSNKAVFEDYNVNKKFYKSSLEYITSKPNCIGIRRNNSNKFELSYVSDNDGKVKDFIDSLEANNLVEGELPVIAPSNITPMVVAETEEIEMPKKIAA